MIKLTQEKPPYYETVEQTKVYKAILTQTSTNAPIATEIINTTGTTFTYSRTSAGQYKITAAEPIFTEKTLMLSTATAAKCITSLNHNSTTEIGINTYAAEIPSAFTDDQLTKQTLEIEIH